MYLYNPSKRWGGGWGGAAFTPYFWVELTIVTNMTSVGCETYEKWHMCPKDKGADEICNGFDTRQVTHVTGDSCQKRQT